MDASVFTEMFYFYFTGDAPFLQGKNHNYCVNGKVIGVNDTPKGNNNW